jgi:hypothetical protein
LTTTEHDEVTGDPLHHLGEEVFSQRCSHHELFTQLTAAPINMDDVGSNAEFAELGTLLCLFEDKQYQARSKDGFILVKCILDCVDSIIQEVLGFILLSETVELAELSDMGIESAKELSLMALDLGLGNSLTQSECSRSLGDIALRLSVQAQVTLFVLPYRVHPIIEHLEDLSIFVLQEDQAPLIILRDNALVEILRNLLQETLVNRECLALNKGSAKFRKWRGESAGIPQSRFHQ